MELTNNLKKLVASLSERKHRRRELLFKAEGTKCVLDTIHHFRCFSLLATRQWLEEYGEAVSFLDAGSISVASNADIQRMSSLKTPQGVIAVYRLEQIESVLDAPDDSLLLALDSVQDPGNLGTIIRTADWFGIRDIICSQDTADVYSPKVVQATMGAISRIRIHYCQLENMLPRLAAKMPVYGTFLDGEDLYSAPLTPSGIIVMGNEGNGISPGVASSVSQRIKIPSFPPGAVTSESLNVATAAAITIAEFRRRTI